MWRIMKRLFMQVDTVQLSFKALFFVLFCFVLFLFFFIHFLPFLAVLFLLFSPYLYGFARCCDKRISSLTLKRTNMLRVERLQRGINTKFCSNSKHSLRKRKSNKRLCYSLFTIFYGQTGRSTVVHFAPKSHLPFVRVSSIYRKTTAKA